MSHPYVVSQDIDRLLRGWAHTRGFCVPAQAVARSRKELVRMLGMLFDNVSVVEEEMLSDGLRMLIERCDCPIVSLDRIYLATDYHLDLTRMVDNLKQDCGEGERHGYAQSSIQTAQLVASLRAKGIKEVVLADDVIFSGAHLEKVITLLDHHAINARQVVAGIAIGEGVARLNSLGVSVNSVRHYDDVVDEICERDFFPGVPLSGRTVRGAYNVGSPYIWPFGKPVEWASIPSSHAREFSYFCLSNTATLFEEIENASGRVVECRDLDRLPIGVRSSTERFVDVLRKLT